MDTIGPLGQAMPTMDIMGPLGQARTTMDIMGPLGLQPNKVFPVFYKLDILLLMCHAFHGPGDMFHVP